MNYTAKLRKTPPPAAAATVNDPMVLDEGGALAAGGLPAPLSEVAGRHLRVERHCGVGFELVLALDVPVLQMVEQPVEVDTFFRLSLPAVVEQVIDVPKLALPGCAVQRAALSEPQLVEQLVEVPTVLSYSLLRQRTAEQTIDIAVPRRGGGARGGLQGFSQGQDSTAVCGAENLVIPAPHVRGGGARGGLQGLSQGQGSTAVCGADNVVSPVPHGRGRGAHGGLQGLSQGQGSSAVSGADNVISPVPHVRGGGARGGLHGLSQGQGSTAVCGAEHVDTPVPHGRVGKRGLRSFPRGQYSTASAGEQTIVPARGGLQEGLHGGGSFGGPQDSPEDWEDGDFDPEVLAEAERQIEARLSERLEQSHPGAWGVATDPQGQTCFWHRRSRRVRWTLPPGASCS